MSGGQSRASMEDHFATWRLIHPYEANLNNEVLNALEHDERSKEAWEKWLRHPGRDQKFSGFLWRLLEIKFMSDHVDEVPQIKFDLSEKYKSLREAASLLLDWYSSIDIPEKDANECCDSARAHNEGIRNSRRALSWMVSDIESRKHSSDSVLQREFPASQKRQPQTFFGIMMCKACEDFVGAPCYEFVSVMTECLFGIDDPPNAEAVRKLWTREKGRQSN